MKFSEELVIGDVYSQLFLSGPKIVEGGLGQLKSSYLKSHPKKPYLEGLIKVNKAGWRLTINK